jgi:hypothetical protein
VKQYSLLLDKKEDGGLFPAISVDDRRRVIADGLVEEARGIGARERFFHWEIGFPNLWTRLDSAEPEGGFDAIIGNPPYVRQELLGEEMKRALKGTYKAFDGMADLYVYFYEQGLRLLRPGGRMGYVVTNKWLKAGYAENVREVFAEEGWLEFVADFGHAKHFFPGTDVFPSVLVLRKPDRTEAPPQDAQICVIPRDAVPKHGLAEAVLSATFPVPRAMFTRESWVLESRPVMALLEKIRRNSATITEYTGEKPYRGVTTGFNDAFFISSETRETLIRADPNCGELIRPYLRGQDVERWHAPWTGLWMIFARRGIALERYPAIKAHLSRFRVELEPKPFDWKPKEAEDNWPGRKGGTYAWYEIQDSTEYWPEFSRDKIIYQAIQFHPQYALDTSGMLLSNKAFFIPSSDRSLLCALNSPAGWWISWRHYAHMKDEALSNDGVRIMTFPIPSMLSKYAEVLGEVANNLIAVAKARHERFLAINDWLYHEMGVDRLGGSQAHEHDADGFVAAVRKALPKSKKLSAAEIARLKEEHTRTIEPGRRMAREGLSLERRLSGD